MPASLGTDELKDRPRAGLGVAMVRKASKGTGAFEDERQWIVFQVLELGCGVLCGLLFVNRQVYPFGFLLGLDDADRLPVHEEDVIGGSNICIIFTDRDTRTSTEINLFLVLNDPATGGKLSVDVVPGELFRFLIHDLRISMTDIILNNMTD